MNIEELIITVLARLCGCERSLITRATSFEELGIDSMGYTALATHIDAAGSIALTETELRRLYDAKLVGDVIDIVRERSLDAA
jgi:acyl carrier protein